MTLIVGLKCDDGVVIAAEMEETAGIAAKRSVYKLERIDGPDWTVVVGGAGDAAICDNAMRRLRKSLEGGALTEDILTDAIDEVLAAVYTKYVDPTPNCEGIALVLGAVIGKDVHLLSTQRRTYQFQDYCAYAGIGADLAIYFLDRLHASDLSWEDAAKVATFVMHEVKDASQFCSGGSQMYVLQRPPNPRWQSFGKNIMMEWEGNISFTEDFLFDLITRPLMKRSVFIGKDEFADDYEKFGDGNDK